MRTHARKITLKKVLTANGLIAGYSLTITILSRYCSLSVKRTRLLYFVLFPCTTVVTYILLYRAHKNQVVQNKTLGCETKNDFQRRKRREFRQQEHMTMTLLLVLTTFIGTQASSIPGLVYNPEQYHDSLVVLSFAI